MTKPTFDMEAALKALREGQNLTGKDGIFTPLIKQRTEAAMKAELDGHLANEEAPNRKNGKSSKTIKGPGSKMGRQIPDGHSGLARQVAHLVDVFQVSGLRAESHLHDQRCRGRSPAIPKAH